MNLDLNWFDFAALAVLGLSGVMAFARGLIREVFSIIAFVGAGLAAVFFYGMLQPLVERLTPLSGVLAAIGAGLLIFLIVFIAITVITSTVAKTAHQSTEIGSFDRAAGLAFGILRGIVVVSLFVLPIRRLEPADAASPPDPVVEDVRSARTFPIYNSVAGAFELMLPRIRDRVNDISVRRGAESAPIPPPETAPTQP